MDRFDQYAADALYIDEAEYEELYKELIEDGYYHSEAAELALEWTRDGGLTR